MKVQGAQHTAIHGQGADGRLPPRLSGYLGRAHPGEGVVPRRVRIVQGGRVWRKPGGGSAHGAGLERREETDDGSC